MNEIIVGWCLGTGVVCFTLGMIVGAWIADISYEAVQKWDGKLPQYILGNGATPFINMNDLK